MSAATEPNYIVPALDRGIRLLALFSRNEPELSHAEIMRRLGLAYATTFRLLRTLEFHGLLRRTASGYVLGPRILTLGYDYLVNQDIVQLALPVLERLRNETMGSANLGVLDGREIIYIAHVPSHRPLANRMTVGSRFPAERSSIGRLVLARMSRADLKSLYAGSDNLSEVLAQAERDRGNIIRATGGIYDKNVVAVAALVFGPDGRPAAGVNVSGPAGTFEVQATERRVLDAARELSRLLGYHPE